MPDLTAWLTLGVLLLVWGLLAGLCRPREEASATGFVLSLAGLVLTLASLVRFAILPPAASVILLLLLVLGAILLMVVMVMASAGDPS